MEAFNHARVDDEVQLLVPNFNDAILSIVIFHTGQSIPLLRYDFRDNGYNFDQSLLSGMISAILAISEEIDTQHKSTLRKIDQTSYDIHVTMGSKTGIILFTQKGRENEQILRDFSQYVLAEFEERYHDLLTTEMVSFDEIMFDDFIQFIKKAATIPISISPEIIVEILPALKRYSEHMSFIICDKLIFMPIFKQLADYMTPNELFHIRTFIKETTSGTFKFLEQVQKFGTMEWVVLCTTKRNFYISNLDPFYMVVLTRKVTPASEVEELLQVIDDIVRKNSLVLTTRQKAWLFDAIDMIASQTKVDSQSLQAEIITTMKQFQRDKHMLFKAMDQFSIHEKKSLVGDLSSFMITKLEGYYSSSHADFTQKLGEIKKKFIQRTETLLV